MKPLSRPYMMPAAYTVGALLMLQFIGFTAWLLITFGVSALRLRFNVLLMSGSVMLAVSMYTYGLRMALNDDELAIRNAWRVIGSVADCGAKMVYVLYLYWRTEAAATSAIVRRAMIAICYGCATTCSIYIGVILALQATTGTVQGHYALFSVINVVTALLISAMDALCIVIFVRFVLKTRRNLKLARSETDIIAVYCCVCCFLVTMISIANIAYADSPLDETLVPYQWFIGLTNVVLVQTLIMMKLSIHRFQRNRQLNHSAAAASSTYIASQTQAFTASTVTSTPDVDTSTATRHTGIISRSSSLQDSSTSSDGVTEAGSSTAV